MKRHNCPNCGAPITENQCPYCGTMFYDFSTISVNEPSYIHMKCGDRFYTFKGVLMNTEIEMDMMHCYLPPAYMDDYGVMHTVAEAHAGTTVRLEFRVMAGSDGVFIEEKE